MAMKRILLLIAAEGAAGRGFLRGMASASVTRRPWIFELANPHQDEVGWIRRHPADGVIAQILDRRLATALHRPGRPVINLSGRLADAPFPLLGCDEAAVGVQAARHLLEQGHRHFVAVGTTGRANEEARITAFAAAVREHGHACRLVRQRPASSDGGVGDRGAALRAPLEGLPRPSAAFCASDHVAMVLAEACRALQLRIPEDVALVGVDNDEVLCALAQPSLSSVALPFAAVGAAALRLMESLLAGRAAPRTPPRFAPGGVVVRHSSDLMAITDPALAEALRRIRDHAHEAIALDTVFAGLGISRRSLERRFTEVLGRTPLEEMRRVHLARACHLLTTTDWSVGAIARQSGFSSAQWMAATFRSALATTPVAYRARFRSRTGG